MLDRRRRLVAVVMMRLLEPVRDVRMGEPEVLTQLAQSGKRIAAAAVTGAARAVTAVGRRETSTTAAAYQRIVRTCGVGGGGLMFNLERGVRGRRQVGAVELMVVRVERPQTERRQAGRRMRPRGVGRRYVLGAGGVRGRRPAPDCGEMGGRRGVFAAAGRGGLAAAAVGAAV